MRAEAGSKGYLARVLAAMQAKYKYLLELTSESQIYYRQSVPQNTGAAAALCIEGLVLEKNTRNHWGCCPQGECQRQTVSPRCHRCHPASPRRCGARSRRCLLKTRIGTRSGSGSSVSMARTSAKKNRGLALKERSLASKADLEAVEERGRRGWWQQAYAVEGSEPYRALVAFLGDVRCVRQALP